MPVKAWYDKAVTKAALDVAEERTGKATLIVQREIKILLNTGGPGPSKPGDPPHKHTGDLQRSIQTAVHRTDTEVVGAVYTDSVKAARLEFGFVGKDAAGRTIDQPPRPFMRPGFKKATEALKRLFGGKK